MPSDNRAAAVIAALIATISVIYWRATLRIAIIATVALAIYGGAQLAERLASGAHGNPNVGPTVGHRHTGQPHRRTNGGPITPATRRRWGSAPASLRPAPRIPQRKRHVAP